MSETTLASLRACVERLLSVDDGSPWDAATRLAVSRALTDHADADARIEKEISAGESTWRDAAAFRAWLSRALAIST